MRHIRYIGLSVLIMGVCGVAWSQVALPQGSISVAVVKQYDQVVAGQRFAVAIELEIPVGWHLYANPRQGETGIDTEVIPSQLSGMTYGKIIYPAGRPYVDKEAGESYHMYDGRQTIVVPLEATHAMPGTYPMELKIKGLLCSDTQCVPWETVAKTTIVVGNEGDLAGVKPSNAAIFQGLNLDAAFASTPIDKPAIGRPREADAGGLATLGLALVAGLVMNLMPCVLPLIPIIVMMLIKQCSGTGGPPDRRQSLRVGLAFAAGIMIVFVVLAVVMGTFKLLWGQQFQGFGFKFALLMIVLVLSLSMFGLFEIVLPARISNMSVVRQGVLGTVAMGMLTTVLATPCGAPLLTPVLAWSLAQPLAVTIGVFLIIGVGMAVPYVLLTAFPSLLNRVPRGGNWMIHLKHVIGFAMLGFTVYLLLLFPAGWRGPLLYYCLVLAFCVWLAFALVNRNSPPAKRWLARGVALIVVAVASVWLAQTPVNSAPVAVGTHWLDQVRDYQQQHRTVIVKFTANWCKNCQVLSKLVYDRQEFKDKLQQTHAALVVADWSDRDPQIDAMLKRFGTSGIPFAAVFPGRDADHPILLRDMYTLEDALQALDDAARR